MGSVAVKSVGSFAGEPSSRFQQSVVIGLAARTAPQMDCGAWIDLRRVLSSKLQLDVRIKDVFARRASCVAVVRTQQLVEMEIVRHHFPSVRCTTG
jgi:hypothetical protein